MNRYYRSGARFVVVSALLLVLCVCLPPRLNAQTATLQNAGFEGHWHEQGAGELVLPDGWTLEYRDGSHPWCESPCKRPEVKPNTEYVTEGQYSIRSFTTFSRGLYGIWQEVAVPSGSWWTFTCQVRVESNPPGELAAFVGIQPWGAGLFERQMVWGQETQAQLDWQTVSVTARAYGSRIRVAMGANNKWPTQNNTLWWDNCRIEPADFGDDCPDDCPECPECPGCPECEDGECDVETIKAALLEVLRGLRWGVD